MTGRREQWSQQVKNLLKNWKEQITINENAHLVMAVRFKYVNNFLVVFDIVGKAAIFTTLLAAISDKFLKYDPLIFVTIVEALTIVTEGMSAYYEYNVLSQRHFQAAREYNSLSKLITSTLSLKSYQRGDVKEFVDFVRKRFEKIAETAIELSYNKRVQQLELQVFDEIRESGGINITESAEIADIAEEVSPKNEKKFEQRLQTEQDDYMDYQRIRFEMNE